MGISYLAGISPFLLMIAGLTAGGVKLGGTQMTWLYVLSSLVSVGLLIYLVTALLKAEDL